MEMHISSIQCKCNALLIQGRNAENSLLGNMIYLMSQLVGYFRHYSQGSWIGKVHGQVVRVAIGYNGTWRGQHVILG